MTYSVESQGLTVTYKTDISDLLSQASAATLNTQPTLYDIQRTAPGETEMVPVVYGRAQVGGRLFAADYRGGVWTLGYIIAAGEIQGYIDVLINGEQPTGFAQLTYYTGTTSQGVDPWLQGALPGYADDMIARTPQGDWGVAYVVLRYNDSDYQGFPDVLADIEGLKVYNYNTASTVYSENPALHLADLHTNPHWGLGATVDAASAGALQTACDDTSSGETRRECGLALVNSQTTEQWIEIFRAYAGAFIIKRGATHVFLPDRPGVSVATITADDHIVAGSVTVSQKDSSNIPTVVRATFAETTNAVWREQTCDPAMRPGVDTGAVEWRESLISLIGVHRHSQAHRECIERLNKFTLHTLQVQLAVFDEGIAYEIGDIITVDHPYIGVHKLMRIIAEPVQEVLGRWNLVLEEYDPAAYSDAIETGPTYPDSALPTEIIPDPPTGLAAVEALYQLENGYFASRIDISWAAPADSFVSGYYVEVLDAGAVVWALTTTDVFTATAALKENVLYTVRVAATNTLKRSAFVTTTITLNGKQTPPAPPQNLTGSSTFGTVNLTWGPSPDLDVSDYELRYYETTETFQDGTMMVSGSVLSSNTSGSIPTDKTWRFGVRCTDSVGLNSTAIEFDLYVEPATSAGGNPPHFGQEPPLNPDDGDEWIQPILNEPVLLDLVAELNAQYYFLLDSDDTNRGNATDEPAYTGTYGPVDIPGRLGATGIDQAWDNWLAADGPGNDIEFGIVMAFYVPKIADLTPNTSYGLFGLGRTQTGYSAHNFYIRLEAGVLTLYGGFSGSQGDATGLCQAVVAEDTYHVAGLYYDQKGTNLDEMYMWLGGNEIFGDLGNIDLGAPTTDPMTLGDCNARTHDGNACIPINGTGIVISDFLYDPASYAEWFKEDDNYRPWIRRFLNALVYGGNIRRIYEETSDSWVRVYEPIPPATGVENGRQNQELVDAALVAGDAATAAGDAQTTADQKIQTYYTDTAPDAATVGDLWVDTTDAINHMYRANSINPSVWVSVRDEGVTAAQATADEKNTIYYAGTAPPAADPDDLWFDTASNNEPYIYSGTVWQSARDGNIAVAAGAASQAAADAAAAQATADAALAASGGLDLGTVKTGGSFTAAVDERYPVDLSSSDANAILPTSPSAKDEIHFFDYGQSWGAQYVLTLTPAAGHKVGGRDAAGEALTCDVYGWSGGIMYIDATVGWVLI